MQLTATIITLNEESNLARALGSVAFCDEVLVVDSGSHDQTCEIAREHGARVVQHEFEGYAAQKNFAQEAAAHDWVLSIDADEELTPELRSEITKLGATEPSARGYTMPRRAYYLGRWIGHSGWYPDRKVRLYDRRHARWVGDYVHESVRVDGEVGHLRGDLHHFTCSSLADHIQTVNRYTTLAAKERRALGKASSLAQVFGSPVWTFWRTLLLQRGFLDGAHGILIATMAAVYVFAKHAKTRFPDTDAHPSS